MADDDDSFAIDALGNRVLIGLSAEETKEFTRLDAIICETEPQQQQRWLDLYEKHETARRRFLTSNKTVH
jgi:hypothetical protein